VEGASGLIFREQFNRANSETVGNGWTETNGWHEIATNQLKHHTNGQINTSYQSKTHDLIDYCVQVNQYKGAPGTGWQGSATRIPDDDTFSSGGWGAAAYAIWQTDNGANIKLHDGTDFRITHAGYAKEQWNTLRGLYTISGSDLILELLTAVNVTNGQTLDVDVVSRGTYTHTSPLTGTPNNQIALLSDEVGDEWDEYMLFKGGAIVITGVPTGYKIQIDSRTAVTESGGTVTIPSSTWKTWAMPCTSIKLLDGGDVQIGDTLTPAAGIWGGHAFSVEE
jgi:hypothetical protein